MLPLVQTTRAGDNSLTASTATTWDALGDPTYVDGPLAAADITRTLYDAMRQPVGVIGPDPDGTGGRAYPATRTTYNADGQPVTVERGTTTGQTDPAWTAFTSLQTATTAYDLQGRKIRETAFAGSSSPLITDYSYDGEGRLRCTAVRMNPATFGSLPTSACAAATPTGPHGGDRITQNAYDNADRLTSVIEALGSSVQRTALTQTWTLNGQVDWVEDANGNRSDYAYDGFDRLIRLYFPLPTTGAHTANTNDYEAYEYDKNDNPTAKITRAGLSFVTTFDTLNRIRVIDAPAGTQDVAFLYDNLDRRTAAYIPGGGLYYGFTWDALGRQRTESGSEGAMTSQCDLAGRRTTLTWPDAVSATYVWDLDSALRSITLAGAPITAYAYDNLGRRTAITRGNGVATSLSYDGASRLSTLAHDPAGTGGDVSYGFAWAPSSQIVTRTVSNSAYVWIPTTGTSTTYANNGLNQATSAGGLALTWSPQGNLTSNTTRSFTYDAANRLTGSGAVALTTDPLDRLHSKTGANGGTFLYDGVQVAGVYSSATLTERWIPGPAPDEWAAVVAGGTTTWLMQDPQQSVVALTNSSGAATQINRYDEYGRPHASNAGRFGFTGQMGMLDIGLWHYKARVYDPALGRFLQTDPVGYEQGLNLYAYVDNDPVNRLDATGKESTLICRSVLLVGQHCFVVVTNSDGSQRAQFSYGPQRDDPSRPGQLVETAGNPRSNTNVDDDRTVSGEIDATHRVNLNQIGFEDDQVVAAGQRVDAMVGTPADPGPTRYDALQHYEGQANSNSGAARVLEEAIPGSSSDPRIRPDGLAPGWSKWDVVGTAPRPASTYDVCQAHPAAC